MDIKESEEISHLKAELEKESLEKRSWKKECHKLLKRPDISLLDRLENQKKSIRVLNKSLTDNSLFLDCVTQALLSFDLCDKKEAERVTSFIGNKIKVVVEERMHKTKPTL